MLRKAGVIGAALGLLGCYTLQPTRGVTPEIGDKIALDVNDMGRAALGGSMGPEIGQIEGRLLQRDTAQYLIAVSAVRLIRGGEQAWSGEPVRIKPDYVTTTYTRHFAKGRTLALTAVGAGALAFLVTRSIIGGGDAEQKIPNDTASARISPRP
ncbi:MAG: hypothetical protein ACJ79W_22470 [Myxococcales bacterium]